MSTEATEKIAERPFHETVVGLIQRAPYTRGVDNLATFIKETKIPKGHKEICGAWIRLLRANDLCDEEFGVLVSLAEKDAAAEKAASEKKETPSE